VQSPLLFSHRIRYLSLITFQEVPHECSLHLCGKFG
jgi:hypothetical protein